MSFKIFNDMETLSQLFEISNEKPVLLFKHSVTCPLSADAYEQMEKFDGEINLVVVQQARAVSNEIESRTGVSHQSPQVIILRNGKPTWHASHFKITTQAVTQAFNS